MSDWAMEKAREVLSSAHPQENIYAVIARAFDAIRDEAEARGRASMKEEAAKVAIGLMEKDLYSFLCVFLAEDGHSRKSPRLHGRLERNVLPPPSWP